MTLLRKTSTYLVLIPSEAPNADLDQAIAKHRDAIRIETTSVYTGMFGLRFRCASNDTVARVIALEIAGGRTFTLSTGYGVNQREIAQ